MHISKLIRKARTTLDNNELYYFTSLFPVSGIDNTSAYCVLRCDDHWMIGTHAAYTQTLYERQSIFHRYLKNMLGMQHFPDELLTMYHDLHEIPKARQQLMCINPFGDLIIHVGTGNVDANYTYTAMLDPEFKQFKELLQSAAQH